MWGIWNQSSRSTVVNLQRRVNWSPEKFPGVSRLGCESKPFLKEGREEVAGIHQRESAGDGYGHCSSLGLCLGTAFGVILYRSLLTFCFILAWKSQDILELILGQWNILRWENSASCRNVWASVLEECTTTPNLPPSGKSLLAWKRRSWEGGEPVEL